TTCDPGTPIASHRAHRLRPPCLHLLLARPPPPPRSTLFPYTTLFRSELITNSAAAVLMFPIALEISSQMNADYIGSVVLIAIARSEEHTSELQSRFDLVCRLLLEKKNAKPHG